MLGELAAGAAALGTGMMIGKTMNQNKSNDIDGYVLQSIQQGKIKMVDVARAIMDKKINYDNITRGLDENQKMELDKQLVGLQQMQKKLENPYNRM